MLVDHPDAAGHGVLGVPDVGPLAVHEDLALVRGVEAVEDLHQGGLAGAVLAEEAEDLTPPQRDRDVVVGRDLPEPLGHAPHLEDGRGRGPNRLRAGFALRQRAPSIAARREPGCRRL